jgi:hypothetical protein
VTFAALTSQGVVLLFITALIEPLIFAHVNGYQVLGAELPLSSARSIPMRLLERWAAAGCSLPPGVRFRSATCGLNAAICESVSRSVRMPGWPTGPGRGSPRGASI